MSTPAGFAHCPGQAGEDGPLTGDEALGAKDPALAIDIGGTKIAAGLVEPDGTLLAWAQIPTPRLDAEQLWRTLDSLVSRVMLWTIAFP